MVQPSERTNVSLRYLHTRPHPPPAARRITAWERLAACVKSDPTQFFPVGKGSDALAAAAAAKAVCARCPVRDRCAEFALDTNQQYGIWGGLDEEERRAIRRSRLPARRR